MPRELFKRTHRLQVDTVDLSEFDMSFRVSKTVRSEPNTSEVVVFNAPKRLRNELAEKTDIFVQLFAGYEDPSLIFRGRLRSCHSQLDGASWKTILRSGDGERKRRVSKSYPKGVDFTKIAQDLAEALGEEAGNIVNQLKGASPENGGPKVQFGTVINGPVNEMLNSVLKSMGLEGSLQDGVLQVTKIGKPVSDRGVDLTPETGLVGVPEVGTDGIVRATSLIQPLLNPGYPVQIELEGDKGIYRIERTDYSGSTFGSDWFAALECRRLAS